MRFLGLDLAWSRNNPSGVAALDRDGNVIDARADLGDDADVLAWIRSHLAPTTVLGFDMPTIVPNEFGMRRCERELGRDFRAFHAAPHPSNRQRFPDGGRARSLLDALATDGVRERLDLAPRTAGRFAFEVFPHPSLVRLFDLPAIFRYKKKSRPWPSVLSEWGRYRAALGTLAQADPALHLGSLVPDAADARGYKRFDDLLDAVTCAYVARFLWRWGTAEPHARIYGDLSDGYIAIPNRAVISADRPGKSDTMSKTAAKPFLSDVAELRKRAREDIDSGAVTSSYQGDVKQAVDILQSVLATEIVCVLRYTQNAIAAVGIDSESVKDEFLEHAGEEQEHMMMVAERINQLGGNPNFNPEGLATRSASEYGGAETLVDMIKENLIAERIAVEHYRELIRYFADKDPTTRVMLEGILATEEEHANDMHDLLVARQGTPFLPGPN